jgi:putative FmdB family regulatory protein
MPIYEFYCSRCNTLFNFFSSGIDTDSTPACPRCERPDLERRPARFATLRHQEDEADDPFAAMDDSELDRVMGSVMRDMESLGDSDDPRALAKIFRKFGDAAGMEPGPRMEEMLARLEAGADPDSLESEFEDGDDESLDEFFRFKKRLAGAAKARPRVDETLYFL